MTPLEVLAEFQSLGQMASFHLADDTGAEWPQGHSYQSKAVKLFDAHPELQLDMRKIAADFLWSLTLFRPADDPDRPEFLGGPER